MDGNHDSVVQSGPDVVVGVVSSCSNARQRSGRHTAAPGFHAMFEETTSDEDKIPWEVPEAELQIMNVKTSTLGEASSNMKWHPLSVRIMPSLPSFSSISPIYCKTSCPKHDVKLHNYALTITTTTRGTCQWSRYPVLVIIRELEDSTSRPSVAS